MKRKLAALMAAVMAFSMVPAMSVSAATTNRLTNSNTSIPEDSLITEAGWLNQGYGITGNAKTAKVTSVSGTDVEYVVDGTDLVMKVTDKVIVGDEVEIKLDNAVFFFRNGAGEENYPSDLKVDGTVKTPATYNTNLGSYVLDYSIVAATDEVLAGKYTRNPDTDPTSVRVGGNSALLAQYNVDFAAYKAQQAKIKVYVDSVNAAIDKLNADVQASVDAYAVTDSGAAQLAYDATMVFPNITTTDGIYDDATLESKYLVATKPGYVAYDKINTTADVKAAVITNGSKIIVGTAVAAPGFLYKKGAAVSTGALATGRILTAIDLGTSLLTAPAAITTVTKLGTEENPIQIPYTLDVQHGSDSLAVLRVTSDGLRDVPNAITGNDEYLVADAWYEIRVPIVARTTSDSDVKVSVANSNLSSISSFTQVFAKTDSALTVSSVTTPITARTDFKIDQLVIKEKRVQSLENGWISLTLPNGFEFKDPKKASILVEGGLNAVTWTNGTGTDNKVGTPGSAADAQGVGGTQDYYLGYKTVTNSGIVDKSSIEIYLNGLNKSTASNGSLVIYGLEFTADDNAPIGDVKIEILNEDDETKVTEEKFTAGVRKEWDVVLSTEGTIPTLISGRYYDTNPNNGNVIHKTAKIVLTEQSVAAWWAERVTIFTLPEVAKWRKIDITDVKNLEADSKKILSGTQYASGLKSNNSSTTTIGTTTTTNTDAVFNAGDLKAGVYVNDAEKHGAVVVNGNTMTWTSLKIKAKERAQIKFDSWISIAADYTGDINLTVGGSAIPEQGVAGVVTTVIAKAVAPVTVEAKVSDVKVGYQYVKTQDILIKETAPGMLEKGKQVWVTISDLISTDMIITPDAKIAVVSDGGDLKVKPEVFKSAIAQGNSTVNMGSQGLAFEVTMASSKASSILISNVSVKIDRNVPESNDRAYKVIVWGPAIAPNYTYYNYNSYAKDKHNVAGIMADYAKVITAAVDKANVLTAEVKVTIDENYYTENGTQKAMDAKAYISEKTNSTMVPVRFISNAFGIRDDQIIWDDANKTVTIMAPSKTIQMTVGKPSMVIDGLTIPMLNSDKTQSVSAEIKGSDVNGVLTERLYVPFRAIGDAFGVVVAWDDATRTAIYNPKETAQTSAESSAAGVAPVSTGVAATTTPTATETPAPTATPTPATR